VFKLGNNRNVQKRDKRPVYYYNQKVIMEPVKNSSLIPNMLEKSTRRNTGEEVLEKALKLNLKDFSTYIKKKLIEK
jgi:hypothetical protein